MKIKYIIFAIITLFLIDSNINTAAGWPGGNQKSNSNNTPVSSNDSRNSGDTVPASAPPTPVTIQADLTPSIFTSAKASTTIWLRPYRYPVFGTSSSDNEACANNLRRYYSLQPMISGNDFCHATGTNCTGTGEWFGVKQQENGIVNYAQDSSLLVTWTLRVVAWKAVINPYENVPRLCDPWHGTINQSFPAGKVSTRIMVWSSTDHSTPIPVIAEMTIPDAGSGASTNVFDPTVTGSYLLTPEFFKNGRLPTELWFHIQWKNDTSLWIKSEPGYREISVMIMPKTSLR